jgi:tripartite-type tricarboxylate transporter receptor subunit TctC
LGVTWRLRGAASPDRPRMVVGGFRLIMAGWWEVVVVPAATPQPIVDKLHSAVLQTMKDPEINKRFGDVGALVATSATPQEFVQYIQNDSRKWQAIIAEVNAAPD